MGPLAEGRGHRHHGRAGAARLDAGQRAAGDDLCRTAGPLGRRNGLAAAGRDSRCCCICPACAVGEGGRAGEAIIASSLQPA